MIREVLTILQENQLYLKSEKCEFEQSEVEYLGLIVRKGEITMDPVKIRGVTEWPTPKNKKDVQAFLGFVNFYRRFIARFAKIAHALHRLTGNVVWKWEKKEEMAFMELKAAVTSAPVLALPTDVGAYRVECDSSDFATGAVLLQLQDSKWRPLGFLSKSLSNVERNYKIHDKELLAVMRALDKWRPHLLGTKEPFEIWTDHKNLEYFRSSKKLNRCQARWSLTLADYDFVILHKPEKSMTKVDALSR